MQRVNNFDVDEYQAALEQFANCRRGVRSYEIWEMLEGLQPGDPISNHTIYLLDKWCSTNPSGAWGNCYKAARAIRAILLEKTEIQ